MQYSLRRVIRRRDSVPIHKILTIFVYVIPGRDPTFRKSPILRAGKNHDFFLKSHDFFDFFDLNRLF